MKVPNASVPPRKSHPPPEVIIINCLVFFLKLFLPILIKNNINTHKISYCDF